MSAHRAEILSPPRDELNSLLRLVRSMRWRLGRERFVVFALRGLIVGALLLAMLTFLAWLLEPGLVAPWSLAAISLVPAFALAFAVLSWPSRDEAARVADHRLRLDERLGTAVELVSASRAAGGRFDTLQLQDAIDQTRAAQDRWPSLVGQARRELVGALAVGLLAVGSLALLIYGNALPRPSLPTLDESAAMGLAGATEILDELAPISRQDPFATGDDLTLPTDMQLENAMSSSPRSDAELAQRTQQAAAEREALDQLAGALRQLSAGQSAADALDRGDYRSANTELSQLAEEADQLSPAAKQQLAEALQQAAAQTPQDRQLADRERAAAQALSRTSYSDQRQTLRQLGEQVERSGTRTMPPSQLARELGRLQQGEEDWGQEAEQMRDGTRTSANRGGPPTDAAGGGEGEDGVPGEPGTRVPQAGAPGGEGREGGAGAGTGAGPQGLGDPAAPLDATGARVDVPIKLSAGLVDRPASLGDEPPDGTGRDATRSSIEQLQRQEAGQVVPEQNLVPGERRSVVRGYFGGARGR